MNWKKFVSYKHHDLTAHHHYQITVIFLFIFLIFLFVPFYFLVEEYHLDLQEYQWYFFIPMLIFYTVYCLKERGKIEPGERIDPLKRPIMHWVLLGISLIILHLQPQENHLEKITALNWAFLIFSLFMADSYWDFKKFNK